MLATHADTGLRTVDAGQYRVLIGAGVRRHFAAAITEAAPAYHVAVVSDEQVAAHYADALVADLARRGRTSLHLVPAGEAHKTRESWARLTDAMLDAGCGRDTVVVALGGGVVGDLAGFVAATFMRGVPVVQCPTSLLAMIDASVGGKTGVDTAAGKNLVGAFHPPAVVLADVETLRTLPAAHRRAGLAEAIKHGVVADAGYLVRLAHLAPALLGGDGDDAASAAALEVVGRSVEIKADIVRQDPREAGRRATLNFGHTIGHAIELVSGFALLHGEAVAIGMALEARLAERMGIAEPGVADAVGTALRSAGLPVSRPATMDAEAVLAATRTDKKARGGAVAYALPTRIGIMAQVDGRWTVPVDDGLVRDVLA